MRSKTERLLQAYMEANRLIQTGRPEMPITIMNTFLAIALWGDQGETNPPSLLELSNRLGTSPNNMSRHLRYLGEFERRGVPGCGWVSVEIYPEDRRQKVASLTRKGRIMDESIGRLLTAARSEAI
jgi:DNA-binding MarR family transcriptional regulator